MATRQLTGQRVSAASCRRSACSRPRTQLHSVDEDLPNGPTVCIISDELWTSRFGRRESLIGSVIELNNQSWQVIGIMPPQLTAPFEQVQIFAPRVFEIGRLTAAQVEPGAGSQAQPIARLTPGVSIDHAQRNCGRSTAAYKERFATRSTPTTPRKRATSPSRSWGTSSRRSTRCWPP